ncbi:hypothetical protein [Streptomyces rubiginosohelvolus]
MIEALFGAVEKAGAIAEALQNGETVSDGSFGRFRNNSGSVAFEPGTALTEYLNNAVRDDGQAGS